MSVASFDQYKLGPLFYRAELERSVAMRRLAMQQYPVDLGNVDKGIVRAVEGVIKKSTEYANELAVECLKVSTCLKGIETMVSVLRIGQILALIEDLEDRVQGLIRYGWLVEREWNMYVRPSNSLSDQQQGVRRSGHARSGSVFPPAYLRNLDTWHVMLTNAIARMRHISAELSYGSMNANGKNTQSWESMGVMHTLNPTTWSTEYVLEKAKNDRMKRRPDSWLGSVPQITSPQPDRRSSMRLVDIRRRTPLHYAAVSPADLLWLKRLTYLDLQDVRDESEGPRESALNAVDLYGETALTIAAQVGNASAVKYIIEESEVSTSDEAVVNALLASYFKGHDDCLPVLISRLLLASADDIALVMRMSVYYGFDRLFEMVCAAIHSNTASEGVVSAVDAALDRGMQSVGGCSLFHLAAMNNRPEMAHCAQNQQSFGSKAFDAHAKDDSQLSPLDMANYFGYRATADALLTTFPSFMPPLVSEQSLEDADFKVEPFVPSNYTGPVVPSDTFAVYAHLGSTDMRRNKTMLPITLDQEALEGALDDLGLPRSTHLLLRIDSEQGMEINNANGWMADVTALLKDPSLFAHTWIPPAHFHTVYPDKFMLKLDLIALVDHALLPHTTEQKVVAHAALALPPTYIPSYSERIPGHYVPVCPTGGSYLNAVFISASSDSIVGEVNVEVFIATPYKHDGNHIHSLKHTRPSCNGSSAGGLVAATNGNRAEVAVKKNGSSVAISSSVSSSNPRLPLADMLPWCQQGETLVYGHRGSGMNFAPIVTPRRLQLGENTVLSMEKAIRDGVAAVEFDVQLTRDMVPVIYHDWIVAETNLDIPVSTLTLNQFLALNPKNQPITESRTCESLPTRRLNEVVAGHALKPMYVANSENTVQAPFATLKELFETLPIETGFDIEVKYPMPDEADEFGVFTNFEINLFVDRILDVVYGHMDEKEACVSETLPEQRQMQRRRRPIVFTSFHPDICLLLAHKVNGDIPVMLLTDAGMSAMADCRCNSIDTAVRFCKWAGITGIVTHVGPISQSPRVASLVRRHRLVLATYGAQNNQADHVKQQQAYGVDIVIVDDVRNARATVDSV
ncbi:Glycerophosphocholine phosphodiesterase [Coemansia interrupta]|uniref:Glycerophosphocholine phosphodiesterase n=1 Tax=Coemansia interrupta TaxID=1126814 RepID=A0A9W8HNP0_9FUNG|nr:Glycerophosphocholine phosphodiesterase [Coemansia interrupta]